MGKYEKEIKEALRDILVYCDGDIKYAEYAQMISRLEWLLRNCGVRDA